MTTHVLMNVLDLRGPQFLALYATLFAAAIILAFLFRRTMRGPAGLPPREAQNLDPYEIAALTGGPRLAVNTAIASLYRQNALTADSSSRSLKAAALAFRSPHALERDVFNYINATGKRTVLEVHRNVVGASALRRPTDLGLMLPPERRFGIGLASAAPLVALLILGIAKIMVGVDRNRPVTFLALFCFATVIAAVAFLANAPRRTLAGDAFLNQLQSQNAALRSTATTAPTSLAPSTSHSPWPSSAPPSSPPQSSTPCAKPSCAKTRPTPPPAAAVVAPAVPAAAAAPAVVEAAEVEAAEAAVAVETNRI